MKPYDTLWLSVKDLSEKKVRAALTITMVVIGIASIVALTSITAGISNSIRGQLESLGPSSIIMTSSTSAGFSAADVSNLLSLPNVTEVTPMLTSRANFYAGGQNVSVTLIGVSPQGLAQLMGGNVSLMYGEEYPNDTYAPEAVIGHSVAFPASAAGEQSVSVGQPAALGLASGRKRRSVTIPVAGVLQQHGGFIIPIDTAVFMPIAAAQLLLGKQSFNEILVVSSGTSSVNATSSLITAIYGSSATVFTTTALLATAASITNGLSVLFASIAAVSLLVAAIGIMNIMLISVYERVHEIGIMKSIGFKDRHVMQIFLSQAILIGVIGGVVGILVGAGASYALAAALASHSSATSPQQHAGAAPAYQGQRANLGGRGRFASGGAGSSSFSISFKPVFLASTLAYPMLRSVLVSALARFYPAWSAPRMQPVDALRPL